MISLPGVHPAVDDRIVHRVGHGEPVDGKVDVLNIGLIGDLRPVGGHEEVYLERHPAHHEYRYHYHHHLDHLLGNCTWSSNNR